MQNLKWVLIKNKKFHFVRKAAKLLLFFSVILSSFGNCAEAGGKTLAKRVLDNGLTVLVHDMPENPMVSVYALVKTGSATEGEFLGSGISHFTEHMLFKGTTKRPLGNIASEIQAVGGNINASTGKDYTIYTATVPSEFFDVALDIISDMIMNATFDPVELEKERDVILSEMRLHNDNPSRVLGEITNKTVYIRHPYQHPVIGYKTLLKNVNREDMLKYYHYHYVPNNIIISIAGGVRIEDAVPKTKKVFENFKRGMSINRNLPAEPQQISRRIYEKEYPTNLTRMSISFVSVSLLDKDLYALDVLAKILGQGNSSRLYRDLYKEKGLVYSISSSNYTPVDKGTFRVSCLLENKNVKEAIKVVWENIKKIKRKGVSVSELKKAKRQVLSDYVFTNQTSSQVAYLQAIDEAFAGDHTFSKKYVSAIRDVSNEEIIRVSKKYLIENTINIVALIPEKNKDILGKKVKQEDRGSIEKYTLPNGLTLLLKEDHTFPIVNVRLVLKGGMVQEPPELNGIAHLMASVWRKGTKSLSANKLSEMIESKGMSLGSYSGKYSYGLEMNFLSEDLDFAINLIEDMIKRPSFEEKEIFKAKEQTLASLKSFDDSILKFSDRKLNKMLFNEHPLRLDKEGSVATIGNIQRKDIIDFYKKHTTPRNMVVSVFGDIHTDGVLRLIEKKMKILKNNDVTLNSYTQSPLSAVNEEEYVLDKQQSIIMFGFHGTEIGHKDQYGLDVLTAILGSPFSGRLFNSVRERLGEAYTLGAYSVPGKGAGSIKMYVLTSEKSIPAVKQILIDEIKKMRQEYVSAKELNDIKTYLKGNFKSRNHTIASLGFTSSLDELYGFGFDNYKKYDTYIDKVNKEEILRLSNKYLNLNNMSIVVTNPVDK